MRTLLIIAAMAAASCNGPIPTPTAPALPVIPPPSLPASLVISTFAVHASAGATRYFYAVKLQVTETSGQGGATINGVTLTTASGDSDLGCAVSLRVPPGLTWDMDAMGYCAPDVPTSRYVPTVSVRVQFTGDDGTAGELTRTVEVTR